MKEDAYKPDWRDPARLDYTNRLADILSELLPAGEEGSVSTVPCTFKPWAQGRLPAITEHLVRHVAHLAGIAARTGQAISLALEPEPYCYFETIEESVAFFKERLFAREAVARLAALTGLSAPLADVMASLARHLPAIKAQVSPERPFGVGLRLGAAAAASLAEPGALAQLKRFLAEGGYYVFTLNGFPYGAFHGAAHMENKLAPRFVRKCGASRCQESSDDSTR